MSDIVSDLSDLSEEQAREVWESAKAHVERLRQENIEARKPHAEKLLDQFNSMALNEEQKETVRRVYHEELGHLGATNETLTDDQAARLARVMDQAGKTLVEPDFQSIAYSALDVADLKQGKKTTKRLSRNEAAVLESRYLRELRGCGVSGDAARKVVDRYRKLGLKNVKLRDHAELVISGDVEIESDE